MQLATLLSLSIAAFSLAPTTTLACHWDSDPHKSQDCCWGGKSGNFSYGYAGCYRQHVLSYDVSDGELKYVKVKLADLINSSQVCDTPSYKADWCSNLGVTEKDCNSDCCRVSSKSGMQCPL
ncbi:hypothetical protein Vi05172_g3505 [Venturia inaequalis]|nr:hypothetical protein Vi05172_g3505 [Venturia inaequalis]